MFSKGYGAKATGTLANWDPYSLASESRERFPDEADLWRRAEESGLIYFWDMKTLVQVYRRYVSPGGVCPEGTDYLTMMLERSSSYLRRRTPQELLDVMKDMTVWERSSVTDRWMKDSDTLKALEWWFTDRNLGSEFSADGSRHILLYRENVLPAPPAPPGYSLGTTPTERKAVQSEVPPACSC